ncbi:MAG: alpha/beta fold hydrolase [Anaerolineales bacterium]
MTSAPIASQFIDVLGMHVHYQRGGEAGSPVVLLHGGGTDSSNLSWGLLLPELARSQRVIAPDWPGYGRSERTPREFSQEYYLDFLEAFLDALEIERPGLAGISMGGGLALGFALRHPERVERIALLDSYGLAERAPYHFLSYLFVRMGWLNRLTWAWVRRSRSLTGYSLRSIFHDPKRITPELVDQVYEEIRRPYPGRAFEAFQRSELLPGRLRTVYMARLGELHLPVLLVHGEYDALVPLQAARRAQARFPDARLEVIPGCGHWPQRERPDLVNPLLVDFFKE